MTEKKKTETKPKATTPKAKKPLREVAVIHFNTPELTEAAILSLRKHGGADYHVTVFDNSTDRPFKAKMKGVKVIDNTKGQVIDFDKFLEEYPDRNEAIGCAHTCVFGSAKHMRTVQELWKILPKGFLLMESDILLKEYRDKNNWYDTGAALLEDVRTKKPELHGKGIDIRPLMVHYQSGSWKNSKLDNHLAWLETHKDLWK